MTLVNLGQLPFAHGAIDSTIEIDWAIVEISDVEPEVAFVVPVHNQQEIVTGTLDSIVRSATLPHEIAIIVDGCVDATEARVRAWAEARAASGVTKTCRIIIAVSTGSIYETLCDNFGVMVTYAPLIIEIQADMTIEEPGFDALLKLAFEQVPNLAAVSGRGGHVQRLPGAQRGRTLLARAVASGVSWLVEVVARVCGAYTPSLFEYLLTDEIGRTGVRIDLPLMKRRRLHVYPVETVMRGPLAIQRATFDLLQGLDSARYFLGDDDHDFMYRARAKLGLRAAYLPVRFASPLALGSTRVERTPEQEEAHAQLRRYYARKQEEASAERVRLPKTRRVRTRLRVR